MLSQKQLDRLNRILRQNLIDKGVSCALLIDMAGNILGSVDDGSTPTDTYSLACQPAISVP